MKNKLLTGLLSIVIALALWLYVVTVVSPNSDEKFSNIPITIQSEIILQERDLMITTTELPKVTLHLEGNRSDLNKLNSSNITVSADVSRIGEAGTHSLILTPIFPGDVPNNAINVLSRDPAVVTIEVEKRITKDVPVEISYLGQLSSDYMADKDNKELDYENISISGPQSVIDQIAMARIDVNLDGRIESISEQFQYSLCDAKGEPVDAAMVTTNADAVTLTLKILRVKELDLKVNVINGDSTTDVASKITINPENIRVSGSNSALENLTLLELGTINLEEITGDTVLTFPIKLPEGVTNETGVQEATVDITFPDAETKTLTVTEFNAINVPAGLNVSFITERLEIQIRGPQDKIEKIEQKDVQVTVDFAEEQIGTVTVKAKVTVTADGFGAVGTYNVTATLQEG